MCGHQKRRGLCDEDHRHLGEKNQIESGGNECMVEVLQLLQKHTTTIHSLRIRLHVLRFRDATPIGRQPLRSNPMTGNGMG